MSLKEYLKMHEIKEKSAFRLYLEAVAVPVTLVFMGLVSTAFVWVFWGVLMARADHIVIESQGYDIESNATKIDSANTEVQVLKSEVMNTQEQYVDLKESMNLGFERQQSFIENILFRTSAAN